VSRESAATEIERRATRLDGAAGDLREIGVALDGNRCRVERTFGLAWCGHEHRRIRVRQGERQKRGGNKGAASAPSTRNVVAGEDRGIDWKLGWHDWLLDTSNAAADRR